MVTEENALLFYNITHRLLNNFEHGRAFHLQSYTTSLYLQVDPVHRVLAKKGVQVKEEPQVYQECMAREGLQVHKENQAIVNIVTMHKQVAHS